MNRNSTMSDSPESKTKPRKVSVSLGVVGILAVVALGGSLMYATQGDSGSFLSRSGLGAVLGKGRSTQTDQQCQQIPHGDGAGTLAFSEDEAYELGTEKGSVTLVDYCDGQWAHWGLVGAGSGTTPGYWNGTAWVAVDADGRRFDTECYSQSHLASMGAPTELIERTTLCQEGDPNTVLFTAPGDGHSPLSEPRQGDAASGSGDGTVKRSGPEAAATLGSPWKEVFSQVQEFEIPQCDGHYVLMVKSEVIPEVRRSPFPSDTVSSRYPGARMTFPAACPSLRGFVEDSQGRDFTDPNYDGGSVIPIYYDYGFDLAGACDARQRYPDAYVRSLTDIKGDYNDPCQ